MIFSGFYPRPNRLNFEAAQSGGDNQRSLTDIAREDKATSNKAHATVSLPPVSAQLLNNQHGQMNMMHAHAGKTYSHSGGKGPAPPVPTLQTQQSAPHRLGNDNIQVLLNLHYMSVNKYFTINSKAFQILSYFHLYC